MEQRAIQALLVTPDTSLVATFKGACSEMSIEAQATAASTTVPEDFWRSKFEAVLIDFDRVPNALPILTAVRQSPTNRNAVIFAVATQGGEQRRALTNSVNHVFERPLDNKEIRRVLHGAYDLMVRERRRYFRCGAEIPVLLVQTNSGVDFRCTTMNISSSGAALKVPSPLIPGEEIHLVLFLQGTDILVRAVGTVVWDDKHGKTGVSFQCASQQHQAKLDAWLDTQFHLPGWGSLRAEEDAATESALLRKPNRTKG